MTWKVTKIYIDRCCPFIIHNFMAVAPGKLLKDCEISGISAISAVYRMIQMLN